MRDPAIAILVLLASLLGSNSAGAENFKINAEAFTQLMPGSDVKSFGYLEFLGGLLLTSSHEEFGGLSAIRFTDANNLVLLTDKARVITTKISRENGRPVGLTNSKITRIKRANGRTITGANDKDSEALEISGNTFFVGYERNDRLLRLRMRDRTLIADGKYSIDFNDKDFPNNKGPEAIALHPTSGKLFVFAEHARNEEGNHRGFVISGGRIEREISVLYTGRYSLTDAAFLPSGGLLLLERYYNPFTRVYMRIRKIPAARLDDAEPLDGEVLLEIDSDHEIDNMEGLAVSEMPDGAYRLTIISDDNFSERQRTLLLEFKLN